VESERPQMSRPELEAPPEIFYNETEAQKYDTTRMLEMQTELTERAIELLNIPVGRSLFIVDIGCGTGISGQVLTEHGHVWVGVDISAPMLQVAQEKDTEGDLVQQDMGTPLPFRPGVFDGAISISSLQWLGQSYSSGQVPFRRLMALFSSLYASLRRGARAVFQFYPHSPEQIELMTSIAMRCGFSGGLLVDYPNSTKAKKYFLVLFAGTGSRFSMPQPLGVDTPVSDQSPTVTNSKRRQGKKGTHAQQRESIKSRNWILNKKERQRRQGKEVREDNKYTGRRRPRAF